jgi:hypothetical protein
MSELVENFKVYRGKYCGSMEEKAVYSTFCK